MINNIDLISELSIVTANAGQQAASAGHTLIIDYVQYSVIWKKNWFGKKENRYSN